MLKINEDRNTELDLLLKNVFLSNSEVVPNIHPNLLLLLKSDWLKSTIAYNYEMEEKI
jgi:hypothetical protein